MTLAAILHERSELKTHGITFIEGSNSEDFLSYNALYNLALKVLSYLQEKGVQPKSELVLQIDDNKSFLIVFWACILGGIIPVPLTTSRKEDQIKKIPSGLEITETTLPPFQYRARSNFAR